MNCRDRDQHSRRHAPSPADVIDTDLGRVVEVTVEVGAMLGDGLDAPAVATLTERFADPRSHRRR